MGLNGNYTIVPCKLKVTTTCFVLTGVLFEVNNAAKLRLSVTLSEQTFSPFESLSSILLLF